MMWKIGILDKITNTLTYTEAVPYHEMIELLKIITKPSMFGTKNFEIILAKV